MNLSKIEGKGGGKVNVLDYVDCVLIESSPARISGGNFSESTTHEMLAGF